MTEPNRLASASRSSVPAAPAPARISLRQVLWGLVLALALPAILVAGGGLYASYRTEQKNTNLRLQETTRAVAISMEREIGKLETALQVLSLSPSLREGDFAAFHRQASEVNIVSPSRISLTDPGGRVLLNTRLPYGTPLPDSTRPDTLKRVLDTRKAELSNLYVSSNTGQHVITLDMPVTVNERVSYILSVSFGPDVFQELIAKQHIPGSWNGSVLDRSGTVVARSRSPEQFVGQTARPWLVQAIAASPEGYVESVTLDNIPSRTFFATSPLYGWAFAIGVPATEITASFQRSLLWLLVLAGVFLLGLALAALLSRSIAKPVDQLVAAARAMGRGEAVPAATTQVAEFDDIQKALSEAAAAIRRQEQDREEVLEQVAESEARLRLALDVGHLGSWEYTPSTGIYSSSATCRTNYGRRPDEPFTFTDLVAAIHPEDRPKQAEVFAKAIAERTDLLVEYRIFWPDQSEHWIRVRGRTRVGPNGELSMVGFSQDITERHLAEERQALLLHELNHRVKNTLATVQSVAALTRRSADAGDPRAWEAFMGRLQGLAKTHDLLTSTQWNGALLEDVLGNELDPYQDGLKQRVKLRGPRINLQASAVLALGLAVHELATNATKYGSLSVNEGRISVMWAVTGGTAPSLLIEWVESGGPSVKPPERQGFGTKLIQRGLAQQLGGEIKLDFAPTGVRCVITFPLRSVVLNLDEVDGSEERVAS